MRLRDHLVVGLWATAWAVTRAVWLPIWMFARPFGELNVWVKRRWTESLASRRPPG